MINQLLLICFTICIYEFIRIVKLREIIKSNLMIYKDLIKLFKIKKISDTNQEKIVFNFAKSLLFFSIKILLILLSITLFVLLLNLFSNFFKFCYFDSRNNRNNNYFRYLSFNSKKILCKTIAIFKNFYMI